VCVLKCLDLKAPGIMFLTIYSTFVLPVPWKWSVHTERATSTMDMSLTESR